MKYDFGGYATKNDIVCSDGRIIRRDAFKDCDGERVPLVYMHNHADPMNVLGYADLENREDGVYCRCSFNDSPQGKHARELVKHGDIRSLSIQANRLKQQGSEVLHGIINEVSLVLRGANPGATIENIMFAHADGFVTESDEDAIITFMENPEIFHADDESNDNNQNGSSDNGSSQDDDETIGDIYDSMTEDEKGLTDLLMAIAMEGGIDEEVDIEDAIVEHADEDGPTCQEIWDGMSDKKKKAAEYLVGKAAEESDDEEIEEDVEIEEEISQSDESEDSFMYNNVFDQDVTRDYYQITKEDMTAIVHSATTGNGSLKDAMQAFIEEKVGTDADSLQHGIQQLDVLFPEAKLGSANPELISRPMEWVSEVWNATKKSPFARVKSIAADITEDEARALGYIKGKQKKEEVVKLLKRKTTPQTVYKLQKLDRDDVIDATELDVVAWLKTEMRMMLNEELSRAILIGDGRSSSDESKINEENVRPIWTDDDLYTIKVDVTIPANADRLAKSDLIVDAAVESREDYMGSGNPVMYASVDTINTMLLARDKVGHRLYKTLTELADACRVSKIVEVPLISEASRTDDNGNTHNLLCLIVNLRDYTVGADKGGEVNLFDDFDINFNKYEYLIETRLSGALTKPYSAIAIEQFIAKPTGSSEQVSG